MKDINVSILPLWNPDYTSLSPMFGPLKQFRRFFNSKDWPTLSDLQNVINRLPSPPKSQLGQPIRFVPQDAKPSAFEQRYAPRIYLTGEIQTRQHNWHDFFQALTWALFPSAKSVINAVHYQAAKKHYETLGHTQVRGQIENQLSLFDECGAVILSSHRTLLELVREFQWKELFLNHRDQFSHSIMCVVFGHAIYEKGLNPYVGLTCNAKLILINDLFFASSLSRKIEKINQILTTEFVNLSSDNLKKLSPFPLLGIPGWHADNVNESFYTNTNYFRPSKCSADTYPIVEY